MLPPYSPPEYAQEYDDQSEEDEVEAEFARCAATVILIHVSSTHI